jgi:hypothetical protein
MTEMNIAGAIDDLIVWDDSEFCETGSGDLEDKCDFLQYHDVDDNHRCYLYPVDHEPRILERNWQTMQFKKCQPCKEAFLKAKELQRQKPTERCPECDGELNHVGGCENHDCSYPPF